MPVFEYFSTLGMHFSAKRPGSGFRGQKPMAPNFDMEN
jgi:hypothetical protein